MTTFSVDFSLKSKYCSGIDLRLMSAPFGLIASPHHTRSRLFVHIEYTWYLQLLSATGTSYAIRSNVPALDGKAGALTSVRPASNVAQRPSPRLPHWWTDDPAPEVAEGPHIGARTVSQWREDFLRDFAA